MSTRHNFILQTIYVYLYLYNIGEEHILSLVVKFVKLLLVAIPEKNKINISLKNQFSSPLQIDHTNQIWNVV